MLAPPRIRPRTGMTLIHAHLKITHFYWFFLRLSMDSEGFNSFHNDGSFMESYMKKMQEQKKSEATTTTTTLPPAKRLPPLMTRKPLAMKMSKRKKANILAKPVDSATPDNPVEGNSRKGEISYPT